MKKDVYTVVSTMRNEAPFILDWVAHYKTLGFDNIVVCTNDCEDPTVEILRRLQHLGFVVHHHTRIWDRLGIQRSALRQAWKVYPQTHTADWVFVCDADEYLNIHIGDGSVRDLVAASGPDADAICVPWRIFGPAGIDRFTDIPVPAQFFLAEAPYHPDTHPLSGKFVKSLTTRLDRLKRLGIHMPIYQPEYVATARLVLPGGVDYVRQGSRTMANPDFTGAQVNHYALRSLDSFLIKKMRGRVNHEHHVMGLDYWQKFNINEQIDRSIMRYHTQTTRLAQELKSDPVLGALHARSVAWYRDRIGTLRQDPALQPLIAQMQADIDSFQPGPLPVNPA